MIAHIVRISSHQQLVLTKKFLRTMPIDQHDVIQMGQKLSFESNVKQDE